MMMKEAEIKEHLMSENAEFRRLVEEHKQYEGRLDELKNRQHISDHDHLGEIELKKKKLHLKDRMNSIISKFRDEISHQHT